MTKTILIAGVILTTIIISSLSVNDAFGAAFVKYEGINGESKDSTHSGWSDLLTFSQSIVVPDRQGQGSTRTSGAIHEDMTFTKELDSASTQIALTALQGRGNPLVFVDLAASTSSAGRVTYYQYELTNVQVTSYSISGSGESEDVPTENFSLNFEEIKVTYTELDSEGGFVGTFGYRCTSEGCGLSGPSTSSGPSKSSFEYNDTPEWLKVNLQWWQDGLISDDEITDNFVYLVKNGYI